MSRRSGQLILLALGVSLIVTPAPAFAYGGPGSVVTGIGALLAALAAIGAAIFGFLWFPLKRLAKRFRSEDEDDEVEEVAEIR